jgi:serine/threonine protein kinase
MAFQDERTMETSGQGPKPRGGRDAVELLADEFLSRRRRGESPSIDEYVGLRPELESEIRAVFSALLIVEDLGKRSAEPAAAVRPAGRDGGEPRGPNGNLQQLGEYRILREIGRGGMGIVYEAEQESLGRRVALKVLPFHSLLGPKHLERFRQEARAAARLSHPNIVPVFGVGEHEGLHYFAMQYIPGQGLDAVIEEVRNLRKDGPAGGSGVASDLSAGGRERYCHNVARIARDVALSLSHAHREGILHRDVKPSNLLLDSTGHVWLADFGLAKSIGSDDLTRSGDFVGTLRYMAPERFKGWSDPRSDVYALGLTLYELLALRPAFVESDRGRLLRQVEEEEPAALRRFERAVPRDLETIVLKAIAKESAQRYTSAQAMADDLDRFLRGEPVEARRSTALGRLTRWCARNPVLAALGSAVLLLLVAVAVISASAAVKLKRERDNALAATQRAGEQTAIVKAVTEFLQDDLLGQADVGRQRAGSKRNPDITVREVLDRAAQTIESKFKGQELTEAGIRYTLGKAYQALGEFEEAEKHLERSLSLSVEKLGALHDDTLSIQNTLALLLRERGQYDKALEILEEVVKGRRLTSGDQDPSTLAAMHNLGTLYRDLGKLDKAEPLFRQVLDTQKAINEPGDPDIYLAMNNLALLFLSQGRFTDAEPLLTEIVEGFNKVGGPDHPFTLTTTNNLAGCYMELKRYDDAEPLYRKVLEMREKLHGPDHPSTLMALNFVGLVLDARKHYDEAEPVLVSVLEARRKKLGDDHPDTLTSMGNLANTLKSLGKNQEAEDLYRQGLEGRRAKFGNGHYDTLRSLSFLGNFYRDLERYAEAEPLLREAVTGARTSLGSGHPQTRFYLGSLIELYRRQSKWDLAEKDSREALEAIEKQPGRDSVVYADQLGELAVTLLERGEHAQAETALLDSHGILSRLAASGAKNVDRDLTEAVNRLVRLYEAWGKPDEAAKWRKALDAGSGSKS